jgi:hypothetical protein
MDEKLINLFKLQQIEPKFSNLEELSRSLLAVFSKNNENLSIAFEAIYEDYWQRYIVNLRIAESIVNTLKEIYGAKIDFEEIREEAEKFVRENWKNIKEKTIFNNIVNDGFKKEKENG